METVPNNRPVLYWSQAAGAAALNKEQRNTPSSFRLRVARQGI